MTKTIALAEVRQNDISDKLVVLFRDRFDEDLSAFRAAQIIDLMLKEMGPMIYNQAVQDVRAHLQTRLDDLEGEVYVETA